MLFLYFLRFSVLQSISYIHAKSNYLLAIMSSNANRPVPKPPVKAPVKRNPPPAPPSATKVKVKAKAKPDPESEEEAAPAPAKKLAKKSPAKASKASGSILKPKKTTPKPDPEDGDSDEETASVTTKMPKRKVPLKKKAPEPGSEDELSSSGKPKRPATKVPIKHKAPPIPARGKPKANEIPKEGYNKQGLSGLSLNHEQLLMSVIEPKFGVELETQSLQFLITLKSTPGALPPQVIEDNPFTPDEEKAIKGSNWLFFDAKFKPKPSLQLAKPNLSATAETLFIDMRKLTMEVIFGGKTGEPWKAQGPQAEQVGGDVVRYFDEWEKVNGKTVYGKPECVTDKPDVFWKIVDATRSGAPSLSPHFTTALPLSGIASILDLIEPEKRQNTSLTKSALIPRTEQAKKLSLVTQEQIEKAWPTMKDEKTWKTPQLQLYGQETTRGFLIMVMSYVNTLKSAPHSGDINLKTRTPIMPRTDFAAMLHIALDTMSATGATAFRTKLKDIVFLLAGKVALDTLNFRWVDETLAASDPKHEQELRSDAWIDGLVKAKAPIDLIRVNDIKFREAQVGALENIVSSVIGDELKTAVHFCPVFEFRDMGSVNMADLPKTLEELEEDVRMYHDEVKGLLAGHDDTEEEEDAADEEEDSE